MLRQKICSGKIAKLYLGKIKNTENKSTFKINKIKISLNNDFSYHNKLFHKVEINIKILVLQINYNN